MFSGVRRWLAGLSADRGGNISVLFALSLVPIAGFSFAAVDFKMMSNVRHSYQMVADTAALAAASSPTDPYTTSDGYFDANTVLLPGTTIVSHGLQVDGSTFVYSATVTYETIFGSFIGVDSITIDISATAVRNQSTANEIAIVLDATNSMGFGDRWDDAVEAMETALKEIEASTVEGNFYASYVPYQDRVNIGTSRAGWLNDEAPGGWNGCVEPREGVIGSYAFALDDTPPIGDERFIASHNLDGGLWERGGNYPHCPDELVEPTPSITAVAQAFEGVKRNGTGRFDIGMAWGWRLLSHEWGSYWGQSGYPSTDADARQMLIFIADGNSNAYHWEVRSDITGPDDPELGELSEDSYGNNKGTVTGFEHMEDLCERIKEDDIELLVMQIGGQDHARPHFQACASSEAHYFEFDDLDDWVAAFKFAEETFESVRLVN